MHSADDGWAPLSTATTSPALPIKPTAGTAFAHAWEILKADFWNLLLIGFVTWLFCFVVASLINGPGTRSWVSLLYQMLIGFPLSYGAAYAWLRAVRGEKAQLGDLFVPFQRNWIGCVLAQILLSIVVVIGFCLLIVPGVVMAVRLSFVPFLVVDEGRGPVDALIASWNRTAGYGFTIFYTALLGAFIILVGLVLLIVGSIPATMLVYLAFASLYAALTASSEPR